MFVVQLEPPFVDFHNPPSGVPRNILLELVGSKRIKFTRPAPPPVGFPIGPNADQFPATDFGTPELAC